MRRKKLQFVLGGVIIFGAITYLSVSGIMEGVKYFHKIDEIQALATELHGKGLRVAGKVLEGSIQQSLDHRVHDFKMIDGIQVLPVHFQGIVPDLFKDGATVIVEGEYGEDGVLVASNVMTACPSKYEAELSARIESHN
jgi:cytochrome c-type biogenesis protein CcmE